MRLLDANLLLYAYHPRSARHDRSREWLEEVLSGPAPVCLSWMTVWAFLRISTHPRVFEHPLSMAEAERIVASWLDRPNVVVLEPGARHWEILSDLLHSAQVTGPMVTDAALAAVAIEHGATLCTTDRDFQRFAGLRTFDPLTEPP